MSLLLGANQDLLGTPPVSSNSAINQSALVLSYALTLLGANQDLLGAPPVSSNSAINQSAPVALDCKQKDFLIFSSGFDDHEFTERLFHEYLSLQVHRVDRLSADDILRLQEGLSESDYDRLVASHLSNSPPSKTHG